MNQLEKIQEQSYADFLELKGIGRYSFDQVNGFLDSITKQAYLQGIRDAKGVLPGRKEPLYYEFGWNTDKKGGYNECRNQTLEAITRLEEKYD